MIPVRLFVRNFMCYADDVPPLELEGIKLACLSGDNGHGKSALLEAITWALWGRARAKSDDELIHLGRSEMEVHLDFDLADVRYRVIRKRSIKRTGKKVSSVPTLELQVLGDAGYRTISGNSVHETQRKINETLRMEYETFINSSFILQNRADEFTVKPPAERKRVLADILGLQVYDELEERARELSRQCENERRELAVALREIEAELARKPDYEAQLTEVQKTVGQVEGEIRSADAVLWQLRERKKELDLKASQMADMRKQVQRLEREIEDARHKLAEENKRIESCRALLERREEIHGACARLEAARARHEVLTAKMGQLLKLHQNKSDLERQIQAASEALLRERDVLRSRVSELEQVVQRVPRWREEQARVAEQLRPLANAEAQRDEDRSRLQSAQSQIELLKALNRQRREDMTSLKERLEALSRAGAVCPLCETEIGQDGRRTLMAKLETEGRQIAQDYRTDDGKLKDLERDVAVLQLSLQRLDQVLKSKSELERRAAMLEKSLADGEAAEGRLKDLRPELDATERKLVEASYAVEQRRQLSEVEEQIRLLGYDRSEHEALRVEMETLAHYVQLMDELKNAETTVRSSREKVEMLTRSMESAQVTLAATNDMVAALGREIDALPEVLRGIAEAEASMERLQAKGREARERLGRVQQMLGHCRYLEKVRQEKTAAQARAAEQKLVYDELAAAFGKNGIQAMIIDGAIPEIEGEANALLSRMTDNRMHVSFETQREAKTTGGVIETLDIRIADELGQRAYELYSGGEAFRVNFAIRIALSKLLAHRAGARLQTLIIDEGFGTQDSLGRERLVECINSIADEFERILVITHIPDLKDAFPVRIDVVKTPEGSQILMN